MTEAKAPYFVVHEISSLAVSKLKGVWGSTFDLETAVKHYEQFYGVPPKPECWKSPESAYWFKVPVDTVK